MFIRAIFVALLCAFLVVPSPSVVASTHGSATSPQMFDTDDAAQKHCPRDEVVWLNTNSGIYHEKGMRWYGRTKNGAYVCRKERILPATATRATVSRHSRKAGQPGSVMQLGRTARLVKVESNSQP